MLNKLNLLPMTKQFFTTIISTMLLCNAQVLHAQTTDYVVTVNGTVLTQRIKEVSTSSQTNNYFVGSSMMRLYWKEEDNSWSHMDLHPLLLEFFFNEAGTDGINKLEILEGGKLKDKLLLGGLPEGTPVMVFNTAGHQCLSARISSKETPIDTSKLPNGIYIVKAGKNVIKFMKK